jgi:ATP-dependent helicase Lhr and Lhr-like helicase
MPSDPLASFTPQVADWFARSFEAPTEAQSQAWPAIAGGEHVLVSAPTGSGKTLAAFLWGLDRLVANPLPDGERRTRLVYVSPLKALSYDVEKNLRGPLTGIQQGPAGDGPAREISVAIRTGDTPQKERQAMLRTPPDVLITTPESLYLMLTSRAREFLTGVEWAIVDEIHAVAQTKRGAHLALTLERLDHLARGDDPAAPGIQRIGLSATQRPLEEVGRFLVGTGRECKIVDTGVRKPLDLKIQVPVDDMREPGAHDIGHPAVETVGTAAGGGDLIGRGRAPGTEALPSLDPPVGVEAPYADPNAATRRSIWPAIYPELLELVRSHTSTIIFVNARRAAERLAVRLNELAGEDGAPADIARAHHGSLAREERLIVEDMLKSGNLPCLVATSSLELGIDMGAVDLVLQVESPKSVTAGLQRIGRAGHNVGDVSKGRIFPKFRADLLECTVVAKRMRAAEIETTVIPRNPLDVLAQQIVAMVSSPPVDDDRTAAPGTADAATSNGGTTPATRAADTEVGGEEWSVPALHDLVRRAHPYAELPRELLNQVLDMLDGRYPSEEFSELRPRIVWDRVADTIRARKGARQLAITNAGTIPDRGLYGVHLPDGRRVGELDEEMVYEARPGQTFLLGASTWRIEEITRDRVIVTPAPGAPGAIPFWKGDGIGRPAELGRAIGEFSRWAVDREPADLIDAGYDLDERAAKNLIAYLREQQEATRVVPSDRTIVVERFRDEIGDWRLCVLSPFGGRVHSAWALALSARIRDEFGLESDAIWSDDGIIVHLPDADEPPSADLVLVEPDAVEDLIVGELSASALYGARFRENAARALLLPRAYPGKRTPLWQQRLKAQSLLEVAKRYGQFPIVLETYRECLRDVLDLPGLEELLRGLHMRELSLVEVETQRASPFASSLLFDYVATYMYEGDAPNAERRAAALSLDRDLLRELLGQEELRELIDPAALEEVEADLQHLSERTRAANSDALHDVLRGVGDLTVSEAQARCLGAVSAERILIDLGRERRAIEMRIGGEERWIAAEDAGLYRDAFGSVPPGGLPDAFLESVEAPFERLVRRYGRTHGPFTTRELQDRYVVDPTAVLKALEGAGALVRGELRPGGSEREWCDPEVLRRLRRASLASLRKEVEPAEQQALARFLPAWQGLDASPASGAGPDRLREMLVPLQGLALAPAVWEQDVLPRRTGAYSPAWLDQLCAGGEVVWVGAGPLGRNTGKVALYFRDDARWLGPPPFKGDAPAGPIHDAIRSRLASGAAFWTDLIADVRIGAASASDSDGTHPASAGDDRSTPTDGLAPPAGDGLAPDPAALQEALWDLVWAGEATNDAFAPLRAPRLSLANARREASRRFARRRRPGAPQVQGRWSLTANLFRNPPAHGPRLRAQAELLLERYGIVTRETVLAEGIPGGFSSLYSEFANLETLGTARRGYFVEGLGGAQFALPAAIERLRGSRGDTRAGTGEPAGPLVLAATDPANPFGATLPWPKRDDNRRAARVAGAHVVTLDAEPVLYAERSGKGLITLQDPFEPDGSPSPWLTDALQALSDHVRRGRIKRLALERFDGEPVVGSPFEPLLIDAGFTQGPRRLTLSA